MFKHPPYVEIEHGQLEGWGDDQLARRLERIGSGGARRFSRSESDPPSHRLRDGR